MEYNYNYVELLKNPRWQKKRLTIFNRDDWKCKKCGDDSSTLVVHHRLYIINKEPWDYDDKYLVTLCEHCHKDEFNQLSEMTTTLLYSFQVKYFTNEYRNICIPLCGLHTQYSSSIESLAIGWFFKQKPLINNIIDQYLTTTKKD